MYTEVALKIKRETSEMTIHQNGAPLWYNARAFS
jgi:hypothetical protein